MQSSKKRGSFEQLAPGYPCFKRRKSKKRNLIQYCTTIKQKWEWTEDQMTRLYSVKAARRWPVHVIYNVVDMALINNWILYKLVCQSSISRKEFIPRVTEELTGSAPTVFRKRRAEEVCSPDDTNVSSIVKRRLTCSTSKCRNRTTDMNVRM